MDKKQRVIISEALDCLKGERLRSVTRAGSMANLSFGEDMDENVHRRNEQNEYILTKVQMPKYAIHISGRFRITCGDEIILAKGDMFEPSDDKKSESGFDWDEWDDPEGHSWDEKGANRFDETVGKHFSEPFEFVIKDITISGFGDLKLDFINGFSLETFVDASKDDECFRFFIMNDTKSHIVVCGNGLEEYKGHL